MRILAVGHDIRHKLVVNETFKSTTSFLDYDILVWNPTAVFLEYDAQYPRGTYNGHRSLDDNSSARIPEDIARRKSEILELLNLGRTVAILLPPPGRCYRATGEVQYSGTGRNRATTRMVTQLELRDVLPIKDMNTTLADGENIELRASEPFKAYWAHTKDLHHYSAYLTNPIGKPFLFVKGTTKVVGSWVPTRKGVLLILPQLYEETAFKTKKGYTEACQDFIGALVSLSEDLKRDTGDFALPAWANGLQLPDEEMQQSRIREKETEIAKALAESNKLKEELIATQRMKILICGTGRALELQVAAALKEIGFEVKDPDSNRNDLVLSYDGKSAVVEIKGVSKSAAEKHAAQLEKWVAEYIQEHDTSPKGLLIINAFHDTPLANRTEVAFPDQMVKYSTSREHCLISTAQLLCVLLHLRSHPDERDAIIKGIFATSGIYPGFTNYSDYIAMNAYSDGVLEK